MNIGEANDNLIMLKYFLQEEGDENWEEYCEAIETLLTAYEKEKEEKTLIAKNRKEIFEKYEKEKKKNIITQQMNTNLIEALKDSVSKDKIKVKIEEEKEKLSKADQCSITIDFYCNTIEVLQSLLEEKE